MKAAHPFGKFVARGQPFSFGGLAQQLVLDLAAQFVFDHFGHISDANFVIVSGRQFRCCLGGGEKLLTLARGQIGVRFGERHHFCRIRLGQHAALDKSVYQIDGKALGKLHARLCSGRERGAGCLCRIFRSFDRQRKQLIDRWGCVGHSLGLGEHGCAENEDGACNSAAEGG